MTKVKVVIMLKESNFSFNAEVPSKLFIKILASFLEDAKIVGDRRSLSDIIKFEVGEI